MQTQEVIGEGGGTGILSLANATPLQLQSLPFPLPKRGPTLAISGADPLNNGEVQNVNLLATRWQFSR
jgi:hypothetical protein